MLATPGVTACGITTLYQSVEGLRGLWWEIFEGSVCVGVLRVGRRDWDGPGEVQEHRQNHQHTSSISSTISAWKHSNSSKVASNTRMRTT